jgi:hypothetical protein
MDRGYWVERPTTRLADVRAAAEAFERKTQRPEDALDALQGPLQLNSPPLLQASLSGWPLLESWGLSRKSGRGP